MTRVLGGLSCSGLLRALRQGRVNDFCSRAWITCLWLAGNANEGVFPKRVVSADLGCHQPVLEVRASSFVMRDKRNGSGRHPEREGLPRDEEGHSRGSTASQEGWGGSLGHPPCAAHPAGHSCIPPRNVGKPGGPKPGKGEGDSALSWQGPAGLGSTALHREGSQNLSLRSTPACSCWRRSPGCSR